MKPGTRRRPHILLRSSWQVVNIGDVAHTPGMLALLERHLPEAEVRLWASSNLSEPARQMLLQRFPALQIVTGSINAGGQVSNRALEETLDWSDFLLHGSGPSLVASRDVAGYELYANKPFGVFGITYGGLETHEKEMASRARFLFFRDSVSLQRARADGLSCPRLGLVPDAAFACDVRDEAKACAFLRRNQLESRRFLCCIPRLRYTPYWRRHQREMTAEDARKHKRNEAFKEQDHAPLRAAIAEIVRRTKLKVLLCPEDQSQIEVSRNELLDRLPEAVRSRVVWREEFWLPDEALSVYRRSAGLFGNEMHSPILCVGNGIPAIVCRFSEQTSKGFMWRDIGLGDWLFDLDVPGEVAAIPGAVLTMALERKPSFRKAAAAQRFVQRQQAAGVQVLKDTLGL
jgi:polysaccharide pyruvyl transferase WcaK-like protein